MKTLPTKEQILAFVQDNPSKSAKRDIAKEFGIKGAARIDLKRMLKELTAEGHLEKSKRTFRDPDALPPVSVIAMTGLTDDGELLARPAEWHGDDVAPVILFLAGKDDPALGVNDRILARLTKVGDADHAYTARLIRKIAASPDRSLGLFRDSSEGGRVVPVDKKQDREWRVSAGDTNGAVDGELVEIQQTGPKNQMGLPRARIVERLGSPLAPRSVSLIAIHAHGIPDKFPEDVLAASQAAKEPELGKRDDLRKLPLITIDPADARDRDDALFAQADDDPANPGGFVVWVAIADVAHYVTPGSPLDREARVRGNSTYFPDRVVPMLPEALSGDLCSLHEEVDRACLAVRLVIDHNGKKKGHRFVRGLMRSVASLNYRQAQAAAEGRTDDQTAPLKAAVIDPLFAAYRAVARERQVRQPLNLDLPERRIELSEDGQVTSVAFADLIDAHRLVEEFMILANVASAETLSQKKQPLLYRVHEEPAPEKLEALREVAETAGLTLAKGQVLKTQHLNHLLNGAAGTDHAEVINMSVLRSMTQAYYAPENFGHFGLNLKKYAHFTSPIRRYSDLVVHRALISAHEWGPDGLSGEDVDMLSQTGDAISQTERRSMIAERDTTDRYLAAFLAERVGNEFDGRVSGIARFGVFVKLNDTGADGLIPIRSLGREYFRFDPDRKTLTGERSRMVISLGQPVTVRLASAEPITGGMQLDLLSVGGKPLPSGSSRRISTSGGRKLSKSRKSSTKQRKTAKRRRGDG